MSSWLQMDGRRLMLAATLVALGGVLQWSCSTCPSVESSTLKDTKKESKIRKLLVENNWEPSACYGWSEEKGRGEEQDCTTNLGRRWFFYDDGTGRYEEGLKDGPMGGGSSETFDWKLDGNHLHVKESGGIPKHDFRIVSFEESEMTWRPSKQCRVKAMEIYEAKVE